jgi:hypothetical protein
VAAEDVAAEALARTCLHWGKVRDLAWRDGWVLRVATNVALDMAKRRRLSIESAAPVDAEEATTLRLALGEALRSLPRRQRTQLAIAGSDGATNGLFVTGADTIGTRLVATGNAMFPAWAPTGTDIAFNLDVGLEPVAPSGANQRRIGPAYAATLPGRPTPANWRTSPTTRASCG